LNLIDGEISRQLVKFKVRKLTSIKEKLTLIDRESPGVRFKSKVGQDHFENKQSGPGPL
jgi:hypothetical protein